MTIGDWQWDETLFAGAAPYYRRGRLPYAPGLAEALRDALALDGRGRLLDVGCGPGTLALDLAPLFADVVGVDPDPGMLAEAERVAAETGLNDRTRWILARAEELPSGLGAFTVVTFGQSFHWMDQERVAAAMLRLLRPGGAFVHVADVKTQPKTDLKTKPAAATSGADALPFPPVPYAAVDALVRRYLGPVRRAGRGTLPHGTPGGEAEVLGRACFAGPQRLVVAGGQALERDHDDVVAQVFSLSSSAPHLFGARRAAFEAELRALLAQASPAGRFSERRPGTEVRIWRKEPAPPQS
ncbi:class I SAM-dependent methyltransferase [Streptacidiphilus neutrinimicus]|uniref:class I SAM-dependent methyltransferase n=1 Tax=Streptacidiphilus neutrinimicus TaxID=105420 RepID=UPI0005AA00B3|nr:class I SAM-dependent methyltransferase [Streptacidiphilus neutrinimicus]